MAILDGINTSSDIKKLTVKELETLCEEIRSLIINTAKENGGHLSSNLGIVETTVALHYVFDFPKDKLIFDVGHQCYAHKILSGRKNDFATIRLDGGISGFPNINESEYDAFTTGHAGTSIAAGIGYCHARDLKAEDYAVIDVVGDGSLVNGLNLEAVTSSEKKPKNYLVILNDNEMSISKNRNALYKLITKSTTKSAYLKSKNALKRVFGNGFMRRFLSKAKRGLKRLLGMYTIYDNFGFKYIGVTDGNSVKDMVKILKRAKTVMQYNSVFLHIKTTKGKGYSFAEEHSDTYHGIGKNFASKTGAFSKYLGEYLNDKIASGENLVAITAGMKSGTGLNRIEQAHKDRFIDVGIAEEYAVTLAAGMSAGGIKPVVAVYSTFMQRAYDEILHDVCLQNLPVIFCLDRAGLVGADGQTHQGVFDLSYLTHLPNMSVYSPSTVKEFGEILDIALNSNSPIAVRYPTEGREDGKDSPPVSEKPWIEIKKGSLFTVIAEGPRMIDLALDVAKAYNDDVSVINARRIKPLDEKVLVGIETPIVVLEENSEIGGFGALILSYLSGKGKNNKILTIGIKDRFVPHGSIDRQMKDNGLTVEDVALRIKQNFGF